MKFGLSFPTYIRAWEDVKRAENYGFNYAWFDDSHMCYSNVFATMALVAEHTRHIKLGTCVVTPGHRIAPITANAIATINELAPGRVILGVGTGFSSRNVMGMPPVRQEVVREQVEVIRNLIAGKEALYREGDRVRAIRFLHPGMGFIDVEDPIPIYMAANGPKATRLVGEIADGWITVSSDSAYIRNGLKTIHESAAAHNRSDKFQDVVALTAGCVLRPRESINSPRVIRRVGPYAVVALHTVWSPKGLQVGPFASPPLAALAKRYHEEYFVKLDVPMQKAYQEMHRGHVIFLKSGEEKYITEDLIKITTLTGSGEEIIDRIHALEEAGLKSLAIRVVGTDARELIHEFGREVIAKY